MSAAWNVKMKERNSAPSSQGISSHMITRVGPQNLLLTNLETRQFKNPEDFHCGQFTPHLHTLPLGISLEINLEIADTVFLFLKND